MKLVELIILPVLKLGVEMKEWKKEFNSMSMVIFLKEYSLTKHGIKRIETFIENLLEKQDYEFNKAMLELSKTYEAKIKLLEEKAWMYDELCK